MPFKMLRALITASMLSALTLEADAIDVTLSVEASIGFAKLHDIFEADNLRAEDDFALHVEFPPFSGQDHFFGATVEVDAETGGFRGKSNLLSVADGGVLWFGRIDAEVPILGPPGKILVPLEMAVRSRFSYDSSSPPGAFVAAVFDASLQTSQLGGGREDSAFVYAYRKATGATGSVIDWTTTPTGDVAIIENSIPEIDVILGTALEYVCCETSSGLRIDARVGGRLRALGGTGGAINAFDSAFLTLRLPPGYTLEPGSAFLSKPFNEPAAVPEPWMTPLLGLALTSLAIWKRQTRARPR